jgi:acyl dehydratase
LPAAPLRAGELKAGDRWSLRVVENLRMTHLVNYAGASGDLVALHYDERIVRAMGHPGVFAHGMLTMGMSGRVLSAIAGTPNLRRYSARMTAVVFPGDSLTATLAVEAVHPARGATALAEFSLRTVNQSGRTVLAGTASALLPAAS